MLCNMFYWLRIPRYDSDLLLNDIFRLPSRTASISLFWKLIQWHNPQSISAANFLIFKVLNFYDPHMSLYGFVSCFDALAFSEMTSWWFRFACKQNFNDLNPRRLHSSFRCWLVVIKTFCEPICIGRAEWSQTCKWRMTSNPHLNNECH